MEKINSDCQSPNQTIFFKKLLILGLAYFCFLTHILILPLYHEISYNLFFVFYILT